MIIDLTNEKFKRKETPKLPTDFFYAFADVQPVTDELVALGYWTTATATATAASDGYTTYWCIG